MIGWYVHHQGRGHLSRAMAVAGHVREPVVGLSSLPAAGPPFAGWVQLPPDDGATGPDPTAGGVLHWAPRHDPGIAGRLAALTAWVARDRPRAVVVDVSVEAALAVRLAGVPVVVVALPGERGDDAHQLGYRIADRILAFWPRPVYDPTWLAPWADRTRWLGAVSRYDGRPAAPGGGGVVVLRGAGDAPGSDVPVAAEGWRVLGGAGWLRDPWPVLSGADVVVTHAGQNALAETAAARRPAVVIPAGRPFGEQHATAAALARAGIAVVEPSWPAPDRWPQLLAHARALGGDGWRAWSTGGAAAAAAAVVDEVARGEAAHGGDAP